MSAADDDSAELSSTPTEGGASGSIEAAVRADLHRCREINLHWLVAGVLGFVLAVTALGLVLFSTGFGARMTLTEFVELLTVNASWFFFSLFALVGLFAAYPGHRGGDTAESPTTAHARTPTSAHGRTRTLARSRTQLAGTLLSRWLLVGGGTLGAFLVPGLVGLVAFDSFSLPVSLAVALLTAVTICAYTSVGVAFATTTCSDQRLVFWLLATYWIVVFLWETSLLPLLASMAATGDPEGVIGTPPLVHDVLLAASPGGAHASLASALVGGGVGPVQFLAVIALLGWLFGPPAIAIVRLSQTNP